MMMMMTAYLADVTALGDELVTDLDPGLNHVLEHVTTVDSQKFGDLLTVLYKHEHSFVSA